MTQHKTTDYEITDYGIENTDYFQGHGTSFTKYEHCSLGYGDTYSEALDDALEQAAMMGWEIELEAEDLPENWEGKGPSAFGRHKEYCEKEDDGDDEEIDNSDCESNLYYYVGLRWN